MAKKPDTNIWRGNSSCGKLLVPIGTLTEDPRNARDHNTGSIEAIRKSLARYGQQKPVVIEKDGTVRAGNGTMAAARLLGWTHLAAVTTDLAGDHLEAYAIADNRTGELSTWDLGMLEDQIDSIKNTTDIPLVDLGFTDAELDKILKRVTDEDRGKDAPPAERPPKKPRSKLGEIYQLGNHRIMCGDATDLAQVKKLMGGQKAAMVFTDPPYGVNYKAKSGKFDILKNDDKQRDDLLKMLIPAFKNQAAVTEDTGAFYIWHANSTRQKFDYSLKAAGLMELQYLIWAKPQIVLGWGHYRWSHEPLYYAAKTGHEPKYYGGRDQPTVWRMSQRDPDSRATLLGNGLVITDGKGSQLFVSAAAPKRKLRHIRINKGETLNLYRDERQETVWEASRDHGAVHPTQKPLELAARAMENSSQIGEIVLDTFGGSGTTLLAAEQIERKARIMELDSGYVDATIERWEKMTGKKAEKMP